MTIKATILQPTYLPWLGYFDMVDASDIYIVYDHVQFVRKSWHRRNRIKSSNGELMLSLNIKKAPQYTPICKIELHNHRPPEKHWETICHSYRNSRYYDAYKEIFRELLNKDYILLRDLNLAIIKAICAILGIRTEIILSSELDLHEDEKELCRTGKVINMCKKLDISCLYDSSGARKLLDCSMFEESGIDIMFQDITFPNYTQLFGKLITHLSVIDLIFNEGNKSLDIIRSGRRFVKC